MIKVRSIKNKRGAKENMKKTQEKRYNINSTSYYYNSVINTSSE